MDGVLADFVAAIHKAHNRPNCYDNPANHGLWDVEAIWGIPSKEFWSTDTYEFWTSVEKMPDADEIVEAALRRFGKGYVAVLTAPSKGLGCMPGKCDWIQARYPQLSVIFTKAKHFVAAPNKLLLDDKDANVNAFVEAGGHGILVPRIWNSGYQKQCRVADLIENFRP